MTEHQNQTPDSIHDILAAFKNFEGSYRRHEVDAAVAMQEEITPYLLEILERVVQSPEEYTEDVSRFDHIYALMLLGYFREAKAHGYLVQIASLPHKLLFEIFGESVSEDFGHLLFETCGGDFSLIEGLLRDRMADDYVRGAAADALAYAVVAGTATREQVLPVLISVFDEWKEEEEFRVCYEFIASIMLSLDSVAVAEKVRDAYDHGVIEPFYLNQDTIDECVRFPDKDFEYLQQRVLRRESGGVHGRIGWWACFEENARVYSDRVDSPVKPPKVKQAKQKKRKDQKKSRRNNRGK